MSLLKINKRIILFSVVFLFPLVSNASIGENDVYINLKPEKPKAHQTISLSLESYLVDLNKQDISWYEDGVLKRSGLGEKTFSFETGKIGSASIIKAELSGSLGIITKEIEIRPAEVDLLWETNSMVPPFYRGKPLNPSQGALKIIAMPNLIDKNGYKLKNSELIYKWEKNWTVLGSKSGLGKNILELDTFSQLRTPYITVEVKSLDGSLKAKKTIKINPTETEILFYQKDSLLGTLFNKDFVNGFKLEGEEISLKVYPLFFSKDDFLNNNLEYKWFVNNKRSDNNDNIIILRKEEGSSGKSKISLAIKNLKKIMQYSSKKIIINFGD